MNKNIKAIVFDKDGTLLDFDSFWVPVARLATERVLSACGASQALCEPILEAIGVKNGITHVDGMLCKGDYEDLYYVYRDLIADAGTDVDGEDLKHYLVDAYHSALGEGRLVPTCDNLYGVLTELKRLGYGIGLITSDDRRGAELCLKGLGIYELFDEILCSDRSHPPKPDPYYMYEFCRRGGFKPSEVVMVGDSLADMLFGRNSGAYTVGVASCTENADFIRPYADTVVHDVSEIFQVLN